MNEKLKNLNKKQFEKCLITLEMLTFATPKKYTALFVPFLLWPKITYASQNFVDLMLGNQVLAING